MPEVMSRGARTKSAAERRAEIDALKARHDIVAVASAKTVLRRAGRELVGLSPFKAERTPSFTVDPKKQLWHCFASDQGGDVIDLVAALDGIDRGTAIRKLKGDAIEIDPEADRRRAEAYRRQQEAVERETVAAKARKLVRARDIWLDTAAADGSLVETYLTARGIDTGILREAYGWPVPPTLRYDPMQAYWTAADDGQGWRRVHTGPAMIGKMSRRTPAEDYRSAGVVDAVHRTWLAADGRGKWQSADGLKPKLMLGNAWGAALWLSWIDGGEAVLGEGIETTISVMAALAAGGRRVTGIAAGSLGNMAGGGIGRGAAHPEREGYLPSTRPDAAKPGLLLTPAQGIRRLTLLADADGKDAHANLARVWRAEAKYRRLGLEVRVAWPEAGSDFNDMVRGGGFREVARAMELAS